MWKGIYKRWNPIPRLEGLRLYCEALHDDWEGFRIWLRPEDSSLGIIVVRFEAHLLYTNSDEMYRLAGIENKDEVQFPHAFWKVEDSSLVKEFHRQSVNIYENDPITHFAFLSCNDCVDVLSVNEPQFSLSKDPFE
ncbi:MAG TPA: hypothetical protein VIQ24_10190 [Pyrinomonadaceae bacterium]